MKLLYNFAANQLHYAVKRLCSKTTIHQPPAQSVSPEIKLKYPQYVGKRFWGKNQIKKITISLPKEQDAASIDVLRETQSSRI